MITLRHRFPWHMHFQAPRSATAPSPAIDQEQSSDRPCSPTVSAMRWVRCRSPHGKSSMPHRTPCARMPSSRARGLRQMLRRALFAFGSYAQHTASGVPRTFPMESCRVHIVRNRGNLPRVACCHASSHSHAIVFSELPWIRAHGGPGLQRDVRHAACSSLAPRRTENLCGPANLSRRRP